MYWKGAYRFDPSQWDRRRELEQARSERELTPAEVDELRYLVFSHTNFLLDAQRN